MTVGWKWRIVERTDLYECCFWQNPSDFFFPWVIFLPFSWIKLIEKRFVLISFFFLLLLKKTQLTETTTCCHHNRISIIITNNSYCFSVLLRFCWAFIHNARTLSVKPLNWLLMEVCFCHWKKCHILKFRQHENRCQTKLIECTRGRHVHLEAYMISLTYNKCF